ncbi:MAG: metallophosphoesterase [Ruminococcus sp.]|nr:metallophosphoesterase [Ruminococcus sp.]
MIYVMSDIHGNLKRFNRIMDLIDLHPADTLYILGDVIDRYPDGITILQRIMKAPNMKMLLGNHEYMMLESLGIYQNNAHLSAKDILQRLNELKCWYKNGGKVTHNHLKRISAEEQREIFEYLKALPLNIHIEVNGKQYILVHADIEENFDEYVSEYDTPVMHAVWSRESESAPIPEGKTMIFGHTPTIHFQDACPLQIWQQSDRIGIDCGCGYEIGRLACLRLDDMKVFYSDEG